MKYLFLIIQIFILSLIIGSIFVFAGEVDMQQVAATADAGFTFLEMLLMAIGVPAGGFLILLVHLARSGTKAILKSLDSNPYVDNKKLMLHAADENDKKASALFKRIAS